MVDGQDENNKETKQFDRGEQSDVSDYHTPKNVWTFARNGIGNSKTGDRGDIGSEPSNKSCVNTPYTIIGFIYLFADSWAVFCTDNINSEIGTFIESTCTYTKLVNDSCLNFNKANLITGVSKKNHDCSWHIYWADGGRNPDRTMNTNAIPFKCTPITTGTCITCTPDPLLGLNCDAIRMARLVQTPCIQVKKGASGGSLLNGSYFVTIAYTINGQRITDFFNPSNVQSIFEHSNVAGSIVT